MTMSSKPTYVPSGPSNGGFVLSNSNANTISRRPSHLTQSSTESDGLL